MMDQYWLPEGHHWDLHIEHHRLTGAGAFTGGGWKLTWHTTESKWNSYNVIKDLFIERDAAGEGSEPTIFIGGVAGDKHPHVCQFLPFNRAARTLKHPSGTPETNRCNNIQVEVCGYASEAGKWPDEVYQALANLVVLIEHRRPISRTIPRPFCNDKRFTGGGWVTTRGHTGHKHAPFQDHIDPGSDFKGALLINLLDDAPHSL